jgi:cytochrome c oxidase subunit 3
MANISSTTRPAHLQHHFVDSDQQFDSAKLGMWVFLVTEILFFGGLFAAYVIYRSWYPELFLQASTQLNTLWGAINTAVLIGSSLTVAMAIRSAQTNDNRGVYLNLMITLSLALVFMVIKYFEYTHKFHLGIFPGGNFAPTGEAAEILTHPKANIFFSIYYMMTGLHGLHVIIGIGLMIWLAVKAKNNAFSAEYYTPVEIVGLYWHLVDIIWIFLFPLLYLID